MQLNYKNANGESVSITLDSKPVTIGRSSDASIVLKDDKVSRHHCEIREWDGEFVAKDLKSQNGTFLNGERIQVVILMPGDILKIGNTIFSVEKRESISEDTAIRDIEHKMEEGKGYKTILRSIVNEV